MVEVMVEVVMMLWQVASTHLAHAGVTAVGSQWRTPRRCHTPTTQVSLVEGTQARKGRRLLWASHAPGGCHSAFGGKATKASWCLSTGGSAPTW